MCQLTLRVHITEIGLCHRSGDNRQWILAVQPQVESGVWSVVDELVKE